MEDMQTWWPLTAHPSLGVGAVLPVPPRTMGSTPPACLDTGSFGSSVPASYPDTKFHLLSGSCQNISEMKDVIFFFFFFSLKTCWDTEEGITSLKLHPPLSHEVPKQCLRSPPFSNPWHPLYMKHWVGRPQLWLLLSCKRTSPPSHLFLQLSVTSPLKFL